MLVRMMGILHGKETSMKIFTNELAAFTYYHMKGGFVIDRSNGAELPLPTGNEWSFEDFAVEKDQTPSDPSAMRNSR